MAQNATNLNVTNNADGAQIGGGTVARILKWLGADITFTGSGSFLHTFPAADATMANAAMASSNVTASRAKNTTYTNGNAAKSILVVATFRCAITLAAGVSTVQAKADTATPPTTAVSGIVGIQAGLLNEDNTFQISFVVPAGATQNYRIDTVETNGSATLGTWMEYLL